MRFSRPSFFTIIDVAWKTSGGVLYPAYEEGLLTEEILRGAMRLAEAAEKQNQDRNSRVCYRLHGAEEGTRASTRLTRTRS